MIEVEFSCRPAYMTEEKPYSPTLRRDALLIFRAKMKLGVKIALLA